MGYMKEQQLKEFLEEEQNNELLLEMLMRDYPTLAEEFPIPFSTE